MKYLSKGNNLLVFNTIFAKTKAITDMLDKINI